MKESIEILKIDRQRQHLSNVNATRCLCLQRLLLSGFYTGGSLATPLDVLYAQDSSKKGRVNYFRI